MNDPYNMLGVGFILLFDNENSNQLVAAVRILYNTVAIMTLCYRMTYLLNINL